MLNKVAVIIPAFDASATIGAVVERTRAILEDVLVVDDGSTDGTGATARCSGARVLGLPVNRGKGAALRIGFETWFSDGFDAVVTLDADGQHLPEEIPKLLAAADRTDADLVLGSREHLFREMGLVRRFTNKCSSALLSLAAGEIIPDFQTGFRLYRRSLIERTGFPEHGFDAETAVVIRAKRRGLRVASVPIALAMVDGRITTHYRPVLDSIQIGIASVRARAERGR